MKVNIGKFRKKKKRKIKIELDNFDSWNADSTLAYIIVPVLKQLKETTHGYPHDLQPMDQYDINAQMRFDTDGFEFVGEPGAVKWDEILDKMIWSFEQVNIDFDDQFYDKSNKLDMPAYEAHYAKMQEGFDLFAKYYLALWD